MTRDLQKANMWKRISAAFLDGILLVMVTVGVALVLTYALNYNSYSERFQLRRAAIETEYGVNFDTTAEELSIFTEEQLANYNSALDALAADSEAGYCQTMIINLTLIIIIFSILTGYVLLEFVVPLFLKNGQTIGKKTFGIGVMREDGVKISSFVLFARTVLGKYTIEVMFPLLIVIMVAFGFLGIVGIIVLIGMLLMQLILLIATYERTPLHDRLARTVTVDLSSQKIFDSVEELMEYKQRLHAEATEQSNGW